MNKNPVVVVVSNTNEYDKIETLESIVKILQNAAETINKHLKTKPNNVNLFNGSGLLNDGCIIIGGLQNNNNNNNEEDSYQNVVVVDDDKEKTCKSLEPNNVTKILTNKDDKINITVTTEKVEPNTTNNSEEKVITDENCAAGQNVTNQDDKNKTCTDIEQNKVANLLEKADNIKNVPYFSTAHSKSNATAISSKDLTNDLCVASSSSLKMNQGVKPKIFKTFAQNNDTKIIRNAFEKMIISEKPQPNSTTISNKEIINSCVVAGASAAVVNQGDNNKLENANKSKNIPHCVTAKSITNASSSGENGMINSNNEDGHQNVVDNDKKKTYKSFEQNDVTKIFTNKDDKINILEAVTTEKIEPKTTAISSKDLTDDFSSSVKSNQDVKSKVFNIDEKSENSEKVIVTTVRKNEFNKLIIPNTDTQKPWKNSTDVSFKEANDGCVFTSDRFDVKILRTKYEKLILSNTVFTSDQIELLRNEFEKQILINTITKKPLLISTDVRFKGINYDYLAHEEIKGKLKNVFEKMYEKNDVKELRNKFENLFSCNTVFTSDQNDLLRNEFEKQIVIKTLKEKPSQNSTDECVFASANVVVNQSANKSQNVPFIFTAESKSNFNTFISGENRMNNHKMKSRKVLTERFKINILESVTTEPTEPNTTATKILTNKDDKINILEAVTTEKEKIEPNTTATKILTNKDDKINILEAVTTEKEKIEPNTTATKILTNKDDKINILEAKSNFNTFISVPSSNNDKKTYRRLRAVRTRINKSISEAFTTEKTEPNTTATKILTNKDDKINILEAVTTEKGKIEPNTTATKILTNEDDKINILEVVTTEKEKIEPNTTASKILTNKDDKINILEAVTTEKEKIEPNTTASKILTNKDDKINILEAVTTEKGKIEPNTTATKILTNKDDKINILEVVTTEKEKIEPNTTASKILTNKDDKINILEAVTTEKIEPNSTTISSKDLTDDLCTATSSSVKSNQGVKSKVFNIDAKKSEAYKNYVTEVKRIELEKQLAPFTGLTLQANDSPDFTRTRNYYKLYRDEMVNKFLPNTITSPWANKNYDFTLERHDVELFRKEFKKLISCNTVFTSNQNGFLLFLFEKLIFINAITKKPKMNSILADKIDWYSFLPTQLLPYDHLFSEEIWLRDKLKKFFCYNTILTPEQNDLLRNEFERQIVIKNSKEKPCQNSTDVSFKEINNGCVLAGTNVVANQSADKTTNVISGENHDKLITNSAITKKSQENAINVNNNRPNLKLTSEFNEPKRIISNIQSFDCKICFNTCEPYDGIILQNCSHSFCLECIRNFIKSYESIIVECPHVNDHKNIKCKEQINESEILGILSSKDMEIYRERQFKLNVQSVSGFIQCCTINCKGFYINDNNEQFFTCYICKIVNCIACKATHDGMSCRLYKASIDLNLKLSNAYLQNRKLDGLAMDCPSCGAIVERTEGCEGMQCIICKTDLCWATKGLRWGPNGKGDESGGCRCKVNGKRCHPTCTNCH